MSERRMISLADAMTAQVLQARVQTFSDGERVITVEHLWCYQGKPERVWGDGFKYKMDEEPFELFWAEECAP